jgi:DNA-binding transcriptional MerR regulator
VTRAPTDRSHLSIGEVLSLLQEEFPDVTISKIRFLESQGLLDPERTPSGYRKFYEADIDRLRWILRQQKDHYLPLKVIKDRLDETGPVRTAPTAANQADVGLFDDADPAQVHAPAMATSSSPSSRTGDRRNGLSAVALDDRPATRPPAGRDPQAREPSAREPSARESSAREPGGREPQARQPSGREPSARVVERRPLPPERGRRDVAEVIEPPAPRPPAAPPSADPTLLLSPSRQAGDPRGAPGRSRARSPGQDADGGGVSLTADELIQASGLSARAVRELEGYGLIESHLVGDASYYDADALVIARTAAGFLEHGIEARHIRSYKVAVEREAGLFEQIVLPLLKQRNPDARRRADQTVAELMRLGDDMRSVLLRRGLRDHIPPG